MYIDNVVQDGLGYLSKLRPEGRRKMILIREIRRGFLEEVALNFSLEGQTRVQPTEMWLRSTGQGQGSKGQWVKGV